MLGLHWVVHSIGTRVKCTCQSLLNDVPALMDELVIGKILL